MGRMAQGLLGGTLLCPAVIATNEIRFPCYMERYELIVSAGFVAANVRRRKGMVNRNRLPRYLVSYDSLRSRVRVSQGGIV